ncbi:nucleotidyltransferase family protein [Synechococcus sp. MIT S9451]|uniref:nucleotidyltransferase family protein n=1 Tax=Synechococcus sp. MIT S9451 TaxID=3082543 RepID=UPI0039B6DCF3
MTQSFRALLLAAGLGTRLRPLTLNTPKCLVSIGGEPLLGRWLRQLESTGCESVLINGHYLSGQVEEFISHWPRGDMSIQYVYEKQLLGTAGTLVANKDFFAGTTGLLIHADNLMVGSLSDFLYAHYHRHSSCLLTMLTFITQDPNSCGIVKTNDSGIVTDFFEKASDPPGNLANGALYAFDPSFVDFICEHHPLSIDFSTQVIPTLMGRIQTWLTHQPYLDIGTPTSLAIAQHLLSTKS